MTVQIQCLAFQPICTSLCNTVTNLLMGRGPSLSETQKGMILAFRKAGFTMEAIALNVGCSKNAVFNYLTAQNRKGSKKRVGRPPKLNTRATALIVRNAIKGHTSSTKLVIDMSLNVSSRTVRRVLEQSPLVKYVKRKRSPALRKHHKINRVKWAADHVDFGAKWETVIFSDEKKFNLDGPDGYQYYWHDLRKERETFMSRQNGGGGCMVWGAFAWSGTSQLAFLEGRQDAEAYINTLSDYMLPFAHERFGTAFVFQHDNASIHRAHVVDQFLPKIISSIWSGQLCHQISILSKMSGDASREWCTHTGVNSTTSRISRLKLPNPGNQLTTSTCMV